jgi:predicted DNA-binding transcriptional regulator AlpA
MRWGGLLYFLDLLSAQLRKAKMLKNQIKTATGSHKASQAEVEATSPLKIVRPSRLARLLDVDPSTLWRWRKEGILPPPVKIGGISGWPEQQLRQLLERANGSR